MVGAGRLQPMARTNHKFPGYGKREFKIDSMYICSVSQIFSGRGFSLTIPHTLLVLTSSM